MKIVRKLGQGDVEHVRSQLLQVGIFYTPNTMKQVEGALAAASKLSMMLRAHICCAQQLDAMIDSLMRDRQDHQHIFHGALSKEEFYSILEKCDIVVVPDALEDFTAEDVAEGIVRCWNESGGRFAGGNFGFLPMRDLKRLYPAHDIDQAWYLGRYIDD